MASLRFFSLLVWATLFHFLSWKIQLSSGFAFIPTCSRRTVQPGATDKQLWILWTSSHPENTNGVAHEGTVVLYKANRGFGFIAPDGGEQEDIFVSHQNIVMQGFRRLRAGERVRYFVAMDEERGKIYATHVVKIADKPSSTDDTFEETMNLRRSSNQRIKEKQEMAKSQNMESPKKLGPTVGQVLEGSQSEVEDEEKLLAEKAKDIHEASQAKLAGGDNSTPTLDKTEADEVLSEKEVNKRIAEEQVAKRLAEKKEAEAPQTPETSIMKDDNDPLANIFSGFKKLFGQ